MPAANTDKFKKSRRRFSTIIGNSVFSEGATTLKVLSTTGLDTDTAVTLVLDAGEANEEVITGVVSSATLITNCIRGKEGTTDSEHLSGASVIMYFTETHWDDVVDGLLVSNFQDGTSVVLPKNLNSTATTTNWDWIAFTPSWYFSPTDRWIAGTDGLNQGYYCVIGKNVYCRTNFILGTTGFTRGASTPVITVPFGTIASSDLGVVGIGMIVHSGTTARATSLRYLTATQFKLWYATNYNFLGSVPRYHNVIANITITISTVTSFSLNWMYQIT